jgi:hypothetical protein
MVLATVTTPMERAEGMTMETSTAQGRTALPRIGVPLKSAVYFGSGKNAQLKLWFRDGLEIALGVHNLRVETDRGVVVVTSAWDDVSLIIEYTGPGLRLQRGWFGISSDPSECAQFANDANAWLDGGCKGELSWTVGVELSLATGSTETGR